MGFALIPHFSLTDVSVFAEIPKVVNSLCTIYKGVLGTQTIRHMSGIYYRKVRPNTFKIPDCLNNNKDQVEPGLLKNTQKFDVTIFSNSEEFSQCSTYTIFQQPYVYMLETNLGTPTTHGHAAAYTAFSRQADNLFWPFYLQHTYMIRQG